MTYVGRLQAERDRVSSANRSPSRGCRSWRPSYRKPPFGGGLFLCSVLPSPGMTLDQLAPAMRGTPRDALIMIRTPEGLRRLVWVKATHLGEDETETRAGSGARYAIILEHDGLEPAMISKPATD
jgi:hypothetical protein